MAEVNDRAFPGTAAAFVNVHHHIFPFKESTLEVLWSDFEYEISDKSYAELGSELSAWLPRINTSGTSRRSTSPIRRELIDFPDLNP